MGGKGPKRNAGTRNKTKSIGKPNEPQSDIFTGYIRDKEAEEDRRRAAYYDRQADNKKKLQQIWRGSELDLAQADNDELKDKRYTRDGHKVMMESYKEANKCRSDAALVREARKNGHAPEVHMAKQMLARVTVRPPTPPPPPPPPKKPLVDDSLAGMFKKPAAGAAAPDAT